MRLMPATPRTKLRLSPSNTSAIHLRALLRTRSYSCGKHGTFPFNPSLLSLLSSTHPLSLPTLVKLRIMKTSAVTVALATAVGFLTVASASAPARSLKARQEWELTDDTSSAISYVGNWEHINGTGSLDYEGTLSVSYDANA